MGFSQGAITSNKNNRNLQRKQNAFGLGKSGLSGKVFQGEKAPINEARMRKIAGRSLLIEVMFYLVLLIIALGLVYYLVS